MLAEKFLANVCAILGFVGLILTVNGLFHQASQQAFVILGEQRIPARTPDDLDDIPARATERGLEFLDDLAIAPHGPVQALQVAIDDENQIVETFANRHRDRAHRLGFVHFAIAKEAPDLAIRGRNQLPVFEVTHEACLVDGHHWSEAHRYSRELPEIGHEPWVRVRRQPAAANLAAKARQASFAQPALEVGTRIDARRRVSLDEDHVTAVLFIRRPPEMIEANFIKCR